MAANVGLSQLWVRRFPAEWLIRRTTMTLNLRAGTTRKNFVVRYQNVFKTTRMLPPDWQQRLATLISEAWWSIWLRRPLFPNNRLEWTDRNSCGPSVHPLGPANRRRPRRRCHAQQRTYRRRMPQPVRSRRTRRRSAAADGSGKTAW